MIALSDATLSILACVAAHDGLTPERAVARLVALRAAEIGLPGLLGDPAEEMADDGDLTGVPACARGAPRFREGVG